MEICNKTDFCISLKITDNDGVVIPYLTTDWKVEYWTTKNAIMTASCSGGVLSSNAKIDGDNLNIYVNGFDWKAKGAIRRHISLSLPDNNYPDGKADVCTGIETTSMIIV